MIVQLVPSHSASRPAASNAGEIALVVAVIGDHHATEIAVGRLEMRVLMIRHTEFHRQVGQECRLQCMNIHLIEFAFHAQHVDHILRIGQVAHGGADPHFQQVLNSADIALRINHMRPNE